MTFEPNSFPSISSVLFAATMGGLALRSSCASISLLGVQYESLFVLKTEMHLQISKISKPNNFSV